MTDGGMLEMPAPVRIGGGSMKRFERIARLTIPSCLLLLAVLAPGLGLAAEEAAKHAEPGLVNLNITTLIQVVNFLILIALLSRFLFTPLKKFLAERAEGIERALAEARLAREAAAKAQEEHRAQVLAAQREAAAVREQVQREVEVERQRLMKESREAAQRLIDEAKTAIEMETRRARAALREEVATLSLSAAERLLGRSMTDADQKRLADEYVRDLGGKN
jgi:F-type H+-transporting ATPase subunit b